MMYLKEILELITIANLVSPDIEVPDFSEKIKTLYVEKTGEALHHGKTGSIKPFFDVVSELWQVIETDLPRMAEYAVNGSKTVLGKPLFEEIVKDPNAKGDVVAKKVQNFIRLDNIRRNMRLVAFKVRREQHKIAKSPKNLAPINLPEEKFILRWLPENYSIYDSISFIPFEIQNKTEKRVTKGNCKFYPSLLEFFISKIPDIYCLKTCPHCYKIFWAKPKQMKFCSFSCKNKHNFNNFYKSKKR